MEITTEMMYLGFETRQSKKSGSEYLLVKLMEVASSSIYEFYVPRDRLQLITDLGQLQAFNPAKVKLQMSSFNNKPQIDLVGVGASVKK